MVVKRFDRVWSSGNNWLTRLPQEDFCQILAVPPHLKYELDGGPGIRDILKVLEDSENNTASRYQFFKSVFLFWEMGAIDSHAKNFSVLIKAGGRFQLSPIYDVISAYPLIETKQLSEQKLKMAMSLKSANKHYNWQTIQLRHWYSMAKLCKFPEGRMQEIIHDVVDNLENVLNRTQLDLPSEFPEQISNAIFNGMRKVKNRCYKN